MLRTLKESFYDDFGIIMNDLKNEIVKSKNLLFELKDRLKALQLRVNGQ